MPCCPRNRHEKEAEDGRGGHGRGLNTWKGSRQGPKENRQSMETEGCERRYGRQSIGAGFVEDVIFIFTFHFRPFVFSFFSFLFLPFFSFLHVFPSSFFISFLFSIFFCILPAGASHVRHEMFYRHRSQLQRQDTVQAKRCL